ncbi:MAG: ribokinase [Candidatus Caldatribacterium sp.]|nr:ribokinase [Candidatus Caldatribacterium sp.]
MQPAIGMVGSNMMDLITYYEDRFPKIGETIFGKDFEIGFGGKGANQAVAVAKLGGEVVVVTAVGDDLFGPLVRENFSRHGIDTRFIKVVPGKTSGVAPIFVDSEGRNSIFIIPGANSCLLPEDVHKAREALARCPFILTQLEIPLETVYATIHLAQEVGSRVILNPAPFQPLVWENIQGVYLFVPNERELEGFVGFPISEDRDLKKAIEVLWNLGIENVLVTLGERGALLGKEGTLTLFPAYEARTVDTTGAGDAFLGALAYFLAGGKELAEAIDLACAYAALSTEKRGTQKSFATREEFFEWLKKARKKPITLTL